MTGRSLLILGAGYSARRFVALHGRGFAQTHGTVQSVENAAGLARLGIAAHLLAGGAPSPALRAAARRATHVLAAIPPDDMGDPALRALGPALAEADGLAWIGYLSTTGVWGDHGGAWVDETTPVAPATPRARRRVLAEEAWLAFGRARGLPVPVQILRLSGIYGPGRNQLVEVARGRARRVVKPGQVFNRIHVDDIAGVLSAAMDRPQVGPILPVADDEPTPPQEVVGFAAALLDMPPPPEVAFENADLSSMGREFYLENKRVSNRLLGHGLGYRLRFPSYREGLAALHEAGGARA